MKRKKTAIILIAIASLIIIFSTINVETDSLSVESFGRQLGLITLIPTIIAVLLAFVTHNVLFSLLVGFLSGVLILSNSSITNILAFPQEFIHQTSTSLKNVLFDIDNIEIAILCLAIGGMVELVRSSGGFESLAIKLTKKINSPRKAGIIGSLLGCIIFFDDYANALIVGPIMKPITDRVKVSREKLSYIVDSTAAPVTGIALVSSWVAVEINAINTGLEVAGVNANGFYLFLNSIPFSFYCIFCLTFIYLNAITNRDFGPMLKAEQRARRGQPISDESKKISSNEGNIVEEKVNRRIITGVGAIIILVIFAIVSFYINGRTNALMSNALNVNSPINLQNIMTAISYADTSRLVTISALVGSLYALVFGLIFKLYTFKDAIISWVKGAMNLVSTIIMLLLAWCLADTIERLGTTYYVVEMISGNVLPILVPILIFITCCIVSCASGSYGCLFVVMPLAIPLAYRIIAVGGLANEQAFLYSCVGSVMAGSIFGDHCSPVTDCTILSAIGAGCTTMEHCKTQLPYAIVCALVSIVCGILFISLGVNVIVSLITGIIVELVILMVVGKKPT